MKKTKPQEMADKILDDLKNGTAPWIKPWTPEESIAPYNPVTGTVYKGINFMYLSSLGCIDPRWCTFKQAQKNNWQVKKGSKGTFVQFWKFSDSVVKRDENGQVIKDEKGRAVRETIKMERPLLRFYFVFNAEQVEGMRPLAREPVPEWERHSRTEAIITNSGSDISHVKGDKACYRPVSDTIILPERQQFESADTYYVTALHELGHWTGHASRLDRDLANPYGSKEYAKEELRAEIASYMIGMRLGIGHDPGQHLAYVDSWIEILEDKPTEIFKSCADANKIQAYLLEFGHVQAQEEEMEKSDRVNEEAVAMVLPESHYFISDEALNAVTVNDNFTDGEPAVFTDPGFALEKALKIREDQEQWLEGSEVYIYRGDPKDFEENPVIITGIPAAMKAMWKKNINLPFPDHLLKQSEHTVTAVQTGKPYIGFYNGMDSDVDQVTLNLISEKGREKYPDNGIVKFSNAAVLERDAVKTSMYEKLRDQGRDGLIITKEGKPAQAVVLRGAPDTYPTLYAAAKDTEKLFIRVPYKEKDQAKSKGALWSAKTKSWYIPKGMDKNPFGKWMTNQTADNPQRKFAELIREMGGDLQGTHPVMDGSIQRIPEVGGKPGNKDVAYVGYLDNIPAGWVKNYRGEERRWKMAGVVLSDEEKERLLKEGQEKKDQRKKDRQALYEKKAEESQKIIDQLPAATGEEAYFEKKGITVQESDVKVDDKGNILIPLQDIDGKQWSHLTLHENGFKQLFKDAKLQGNFYVLGVKSHQELTSDIYIAEGYSTAATIHEATGKPVTVAVSSNNLQYVAENIASEHPNQSIFVMADNDQHLETEGKINVGLVKATETAKSIDGHVISPIFEENMPDKSRTDFNDMARMHGKESVRGHIKAQVVLAHSKKKMHDRQQTRKQEKTEKIAAVLEQ